ncbi:hypothetical protein ACH5RR_008490 [Cinchona calisaya]|uniref:Uncharacterized protein n=1 Tax=Cinchona calisaya TaxID=153742 RepID=A0ABD3AC78_9GENT
MATFTDEFKVSTSTSMGAVQILGKNHGQIVSFISTVGATRPSSPQPKSQPTTADIKTILKVEKINWLRFLYDIPRECGHHAHNPPEGFVTIYFYQLTTGLCFPIYEILLAYYSFFAIFLS